MYHKPFPGDPVSNKKKSSTMTWVQHFKIKNNEVHTCNFKALHFIRVQRKKHNRKTVVHNFHFYLKYMKSLCPKTTTEMKEPCGATDTLPHSLGCWVSAIEVLSQTEKSKQASVALKTVLKQSKADRFTEISFRCTSEIKMLIRNLNFLT